MVDLTPFLLRHYIERVNDGYSELAYPALEIIATYLNEGRDLPAEAKTYLVAALKEISAPPKKGKRVQPAIALKLAGRKHISTENEAIELARLIHDAKLEGADATEAMRWYAGQKGASFEKFRAAYYKYKDALKVYPDN